MLNRDYKKLNVEVKPSPELIAQTKEKMRQAARHRPAFQPKWIACYGVGAVALILVVAITLTGILLPSGVLTLDAPSQASSTESVSSEQDTASSSAKPNYNGIPDWYAPGNLRVTAIQNKTTANQQMAVSDQTLSPTPLGVRTVAATDTSDADTEEIKVPDGYRIYEWSEWVGEDYITVIAEDEEGEHGKCSHRLYVNRNTGALICLNHLGQQLAEEGGLVKSGYQVFVVGGNPETGDCIFELANKNGKDLGYYAASADGQIIKLPFSTAANARRDSCFSPSHKYYAYLDRKGNYGNKEAVWLVTLDGGKIEVKDITKATGAAYEAGEDSRFTQGDRFLIYNVLSEDGGIYHYNAYEDWVVYDTQTGAAFRGRGEFMRFLHDNTAAIVDTVDGLKVLDLTTGEDITQSTALSASEQLLCDSINYYHDTYGLVFHNLTLKSCFDKTKQDVLVREWVSAYYEKDGYLYLYTHGDQAIECYLIETGESFYRPIRQEWLDEVAACQTKGYISYSLNLNIEGTEVLLSYRAEDYRSTEQSDEKNFIASFQMSNSLAELAEFVRLAPTDGVKATYELEIGDGFTSLTFYSAITPTRGSATAYTAVEDYRDHTFTLYQYNPSWGIYQSYYLSPSVSFRKELKAGVTQEKTCAVYSDLQVAAVPFDFQQLYTDGKMDEEKIRRCRIQRILDKRFVDSVNMEIYGVLVGYETNDTSLYYELLEFALDKTVFKPITAEETGLFDYSERNGTRYTLRVRYSDVIGLGAGDIRIWRTTTGKPYISCYGYIYITEAEYDYFVKRFQAIFEAAKNQ